MDLGAPHRDGSSYGSHDSPSRMSASNLKNDPSSGTFNNGNGSPALNFEERVSLLSQYAEPHPFDIEMRQMPHVSGSATSISSGSSPFPSNAGGTLPVKLESHDYPSLLGNISPTERRSSALSRPGRVLFQGRKHNDASGAEKKHTKCNRNHVRSAWLSPYFLIAFLLILLVLSAGSILLWRLSKEKNGFAHISAHCAWTFGPTALLTVIVGFWGPVSYSCRML